MSHPFRSQSFQEVAQDLAAACDWFDRHGIQYSKTRVGRYNFIWERLANRQREGTIEGFEEDFTFEEWVNAAHGVREIIDIHSAFRGKETEHLVDRLKQVVRGHELYVHDDEGRSGRDFLVELAVAARFARKGLDVRFDSLADVVVMHEDWKLFVECKRLRSEKKVEARFREGIGQLEERYKKESGAEGSHGILVVSISRVINPSFALLRGETERRVSRKASRYVRTFLEDNQRHWLRERSARTLGVVAYLETLVVIESENRMLTTVRQAGVSNCVPTGSNSYRLLEIISRGILGGET